MSTPATSTLALRAFGAWATLDADTRVTIVDRASTQDPGVRERTRALIEQVRLRGDAALHDFARDFDQVELPQLEVPRAAWDAALATLDPALRRSLERAARNIATVHAAFRPTETVCSPEPGITVGRRPDPLQRVGIYAPGGRAAYPSSLLMGAIPARVAGVSDVIVCSPPGPDGMPSPVVLAAAALANVDRVFALGGAGAIAAMALGTATWPKPSCSSCTEWPSMRPPARASCSCSPTPRPMPWPLRARCWRRPNTIPTPR